jgi:hypothetical protein
LYDSSPGASSFRSLSLVKSVDQQLMTSWDQLSRLAKEFVYVSRLYARIIVNELRLPSHLKTIRPQKQLGGIAGRLLQLCVVCAIVLILGGGWWLVVVYVVYSWHLLAG